ncbi:MAG: transcriptional repressor [Sulfuricurvum sp.]|nr:transcriptional repressor [Sulfuricurvum sp.]MDD5386476.1 transcriptional repressor [Sulfuricurvum sp.]
MKNRHLLQHYKLKATPQRIAIIKLMEYSGHISIDDLFKEIREKFTSISLATLYKNIHTMISVSLIREVKIPGQKAKYEIEKVPHAHILCKTCGELKDISFDPITLVEDTVKSSDYRVDEVSIMISGICPNCK